MPFSFLSANLSWNTETPYCLATRIKKRVLFFCTGQGNSSSSFTSEKILNVSQMDQKSIFCAKKIDATPPPTESVVWCRSGGFSNHFKFSQKKVSMSDSVTHIYSVEGSYSSCKLIQLDSCFLVYYTEVVLSQNVIFSSTK